jgi:hypothetical protein
MLKKFGIVATLCVFVVGCSSLKLAYGFLETMVRDRAEIYLDIQEEDNQNLENQISALVSWHRKEMLPQYAAFFRSQAQLVEGFATTRRQVDKAVATFRMLIRDTSIGAAPYISRVLIKHTSESKVSHIQEAMQEALGKRRERRDKPLKEQIDNAVERSVKNYERFLGSLTEVQIAIVRKHKTNTYDPTGKWLSWREKRDRDFVRFLRTKPTILDIEEYVKVALTKPEKIVGQAYGERANLWWAEQASLLYDLMLSLDTEQRKTLTENLRGYATDMVELAGAS